VQKESQQDLKFHCEGIGRGPRAAEVSDFMGLSSRQTVDIVHSDWEEWQKKVLLLHAKLELNNFLLQRYVRERGLDFISIRDKLLRETGECIRFLRSWSSAMKRCCWLAAKIQYYKCNCFLSIFYSHDKDEFHYCNNKLN